MINEQFGVFEITPQQGKDENGLILGPYPTEDEAKQNALKYGYYGDNYYVGDLNDKGYDFFISNKKILKKEEFIETKTNNEFLSLSKDFLSELEMFKDAEIIIIDDPYSIVNEIDKPVELVSVKIGRDYKFKGKCFLYDVNITPKVYSPDELFKTINDGLITPALYNPKNFEPYKKIILSYELKNGELEEQRESLHKRLDDIINNPNKYDPYGSEGIILRGIFEETESKGGNFINENVKNYQILNEPKYFAVFYLQKLNGKEENTFSLSMKTTFILKEYEENFKSEFLSDKLINEEELLSFCSKHNIPLELK